MGATQSKPRGLHLGLGAATVVIAIIAVTLLMRHHYAAANDNKPEARETEDSPLQVSVTTVRPQHNPDFKMTVERPCSVDAYNRVEVETRVAGIVSSVNVAIGSPVKKDDVLLKLSIPDVVAAEREAWNIISQRKREQQVAEASTNAARIAVQTAEANREVQKSLLVKAKADVAYKKKVLENYEQLLKNNAIQPIVRDQAVLDLAVAQAAEETAKAGEKKADSEVHDALATVGIREADTARIKQMVEVAISEDNKAKSLVDYGTVKAPFTGTVVSRDIDPGDFVQNASRGRSNPLLVLERHDIMTVVMRVPDNYAAFVNEGTEAVIRLDALPGVTIKGRVSRSSHSLVTEEHDRTMRVEVDLWNRNPSEFAQFKADDANRKDLKGGVWPLVPEITNKDPLKRSTHLLAGYYGKMTLVLKTFGDVNLIPSKAVIREAGRTYVYVVQNGKSHRMPVDVQLDDGNLAKVVQLDDHNHVVGELKGNEEIITSNQEELTEGQPVKATPEAEVDGTRAKHDAH